MEYGYSYHCGANVIVEIDGMPLLECCGVRYSVMESKRPIYGYSSRHYDAIANGQVLVEGALIINYVDQNYLFRAIEMATNASGETATGEAPPPDLDLSADLRDLLANEGNAQSLLNTFQLNPTNNPAIPQIMQSHGWQASDPAAIGKQYVVNPHDVFGGLDLRITFGDREEYNFYRGMTSNVIQGLTFIGRGMQIAIDEQVLVEEYPFIARNIVHEVQPFTLDYNAQEGFTSEGSDTQTFTLAKAPVGGAINMPSNQFNF
jgi:hypothetical protein